MKNNFFKIMPVILAVALMATGCAKNDSNSTNINTPTVNNSNDNSESIVSGTESSSINSSESTGGTSSESSSESEASSVDNPSEQSKTLTVYFGDNGSAFTLHLYDNDTAAAIVKHVGTSDWRLPIYHFDDYENWEVMQYYDIPSRYEIPSNAEAITSEKAGEVYYSEPNRIMMFYGDAEVSGEYTKVGYFDFTEEFKSAVENNPVLEGWGNKIVIIEPGD